jgi:hypothetical protein
MMAEFQFIINGELVLYDKYEDIPEDFEHVIRFIPDIPPEPHTEDEHAEMALWNTRLQELMEKERARSN